MNRRGAQAARVNVVNVPNFSQGKLPKSRLPDTWRPWLDRVLRNVIAGKFEASAGQQFYEDDGRATLLVSFGRHSHVQWTPDELNMVSGLNPDRSSG